MLPISNPVLAKLKLEANFKEFEMIHLLKPHEWVCMQTFFYVHKNGTCIEQLKSCRTIAPKLVQVRQLALQLLMKM